MNLVLKDKELKYLEILNIDAKTIIVVQANISGDNKRSSNGFYLVNHFHNMLDFDMHSFNSNYAGYYIIYTSAKDPFEVKKSLVDIESTSYLGRFIDIDVYSNKQLISRKNKRICPICSDNVVTCRKEQKHPGEYEKLMDKMINIHKNRIKQLDIIEKAMYEELHLTPSFGLVNQYSNGIHQDMTYNDFKNSIKVLKPYIYQILDLSLANYDDYEKYLQANKIGIKSEQAMFNITNGINTYKGLIFILYSFLIYQDNKNVFKAISKIYQYHSLNNFKANSYFRKSLKNGFKIIQKAALIDDLTIRFIYLVSQTYDTTIINKHNLAMQKTVHFKAKQFLNNQITAEQLNQYFLNHRISPGGSADLLILTIIYKNIINNTSL